MNRSLLFIVGSDPRVSARPAEAIRIAAGVGTWRKVDVKVHLREAAVLALSEMTGDLVDEENYSCYLPILDELGGVISVQKSAPLLSSVGRPSATFREIGEDELAALAANSDAVAYW